MVVIYESTAFWINFGYRSWDGGLWFNIPNRYPSFYSGLFITASVVGSDSSYSRLLIEETEPVAAMAGPWERSNMSCGGPFRAPSSPTVWAASSGSPATMKTPTGEVVLVTALVAVSLAWAIRNWCGVERGQRWHDLVVPKGLLGHLFIGDLTSTRCQPGLQSIYLKDGFESWRNRFESEGERSYMGWTQFGFGFGFGSGLNGKLGWVGWWPSQERKKG
jgi:hypothetical protein